MIQFTAEEMESLRKKAGKNKIFINKLVSKVKEVWDSPLLIQTKGLGNWGLYYFCPQCSLPLVFDREKPRTHQCPECGNVYTGEPYDGTWWYKINTQNQDAAKHLGILYQLTQNRDYGRKAAQILLSYAEYYPDYEVHGDIPYNGPGKANAQTLDEAIFLRTLAFAYDFISDCMTKEEKAIVCSRLFSCGVDFLMEHRHPQIHNHEVIINSAIAVLGILLNKKEIVEAALNDPYGFLYQLEHGVQEDGIWFEGTFGYHYYALENFMAFEMFAIHTEYSNINHPGYKIMFEVVLDYILEDGSFPLLNDVYVGHGSLAGKYIYEFAYRHISSLRMTQIMNLIYKNQERTNLDAFLYGVDYIENAEQEFQTFHSDKGSGYTVLRGMAQRYLIFKHGNYGGEHDHYDRLGISYYSHGYPVIPDIGTTGYGAVLHYDYYKNTGTHNTICINEENQPPLRGWTSRYETKDGITYVEAKADWRLPYKMPDSFTIVQWDEESYKDVSMTRKIAWADDYVVDYVEVEGGCRKSIDLAFHIAGERVQGDEICECVNVLSHKKPLKYLHDVVSIKEDKVKNIYRIGDGSLNLAMWTYSPDGQIYYAKGPDNPSVHDLEYVLCRSYAEKACFINVFQTYKIGDSIDIIKNVEIEVNEGKALIKVETEQATRIITFEE